VTFAVALRKSLLLRLIVRLRGIRLLLVLTAVVGLLSSGRMPAQDDPNDAPLGDIARNLRKKNLASKPVIDDDNLSQVMEQADDRQRSGLRYLMAGETKGFQLAAPDVTCCTGRPPSKEIHLLCQSSTAQTGMSANWLSR
jgi:hypothetical protein